VVVGLCAVLGTTGDHHRGVQLGIFISLGRDGFWGKAEMKSPGKKDTNPKDACGTAKGPLSTVSGPFIHAVGLALMEGARKYGRHNYRACGVRYSVYYDALMRHMTAWWEGEDNDPDSGLPHPVKAAACLAVLFDSMVQQNATDDRPPKSPQDWMDRINDGAKVMLEKYPESLPPHTEL
jgi:hypothetical protein